MEWYKKSFRRCLVDMHIPDWDPDYFFSKIDPEDYVKKMKETGVDAAIVYATSCVGLCNFPTKVGKQHAGLKGRDVLGEIMRGVRREGITPVMYINFWSTWAYQEHPDWRCTDPEGRGTLEYLWNQPGRYGVCCMNSPYADYVLALTDELCENYDFDGFWVDMIAWHTMCYCPHCQKRFREETGHGLPRTVDYQNPVWNLFRKKRAEWNAEIFSRIVERVHKHKPGISVVCNTPYYQRVLYGKDVDYSRIGTFASSDYRMDRIRHSYISKVFYSITANHPFEYLGSVMDPSLEEHSVIKSEERLQALMFSALSNNGRYGFIDAIDPCGTLNPRVYRRMKKIFDIQRPYEPYLRPEVDYVQDAGLYMNFESSFDPAEDLKPVAEVSLQFNPHQEGLVEAARALIESHIPFGVLTKFDLPTLSRHRLLILSDLLTVTEEEAAALEQFVEEGGCIYASGRTGLYSTEGNMTSGRLEKLLGVSFEGVTEDTRSFIRPAEGCEELLCDYTKLHPLSVDTQQTLAVPHGDTQVLGYLTLPLVPVHDHSRFASAISDPPGRHTDYASLTLHRYGKGKVLYSASKLETQHKPDQRQAFLNLIGLLKEHPWSFETDAPKCVELTLHEQKEDHRYILNVLSVQEELPNLPVYDVKLQIAVPQEIKAERLAPTEKELSFEKTQTGISFTLPKLELYEMILLEY